MINGVIVTPLNQILDERGKIMHFFRNDEAGFDKFGEVYFSQVMPGAIKAWHLHKKMDLNYCVVMGKIKLVLVDDRAESSTYKQITELFLSPEKHSRIHVPHGVWNGFKGIGTEPAIVANLASIPHDTLEIIRMDPFDKSFNYDWGIKNG